MCVCSCVKQSGAKGDGDGIFGENLYDGCITDVSSDGTVDYRGRPADKATVGKWKAVSFIMGAVVLERLAYYGIASNLISYLTIKLHEGSAEAVTNVWVWGGVAWLLPLVAGFVADSYLGRFRTITYSLLIYVVGMILLTMAVSVPGLRPPDCPTNIDCEPASTLQVRTFYVALYIVAIGVGGVKPCFSALGADQFEEEDTKERLMKHSYFNYWWVAVTAGAFVSFTLLVYIEDRVGYGWGYGIPTVGMVIAFAVFLLGTRTYRYKLSKGSPFTQVACVLVTAVRNHRVQVPDDSALLHEVVEPQKRNLRHTDHLRYLDKAATLPTSSESHQSSSSSSSKWPPCTVTQVEEVKLLAQVMPVWFTTLIFVVTIQQMSTFFLRQGISMDLSMGFLHFQIPPATLELACGLTALPLIFFYDLCLVPYVRKFTGNERGFSLLQRLGIGLMITVVGMAVAAAVEMRRLRIVAEFGLEDSTEPVPMSVFWLVPQYSIMGVAQVFAYMGQLEFFYDQVPDNMQTMGTALFMSNTAVAQFVCTFILGLVTSVTSRGGGQPWIVSSLNQSRLDKYYWMLTGLSALNFLAFFYVALGYTYKTTAGRRGVPEQEKIPVEPLILD